jgi:hypothetical protein
MSTAPIPVAPGLRAFLSGLVDYAGLFPPASLPLEPAVRNYAAYQQSAEAWMLGRFICPAARLPELDAWVSLFDAARPLTLSALGRVAQSREDFLRVVRDDLTVMAAFRVRHGERVSVEMMEMPVPAGVGIHECLPAAAEAIERAGPPRLTPFFEIQLTGDWKASITAAVSQLAAHNQQWGGARCQPAGFKLRTGGTAADAFPAPEVVAHALTACREQGVALKCTAGLHHPVRRFDASVQTKMYGFLNVFGAEILAHARGWSAAQVQRVLEDEDAAHFRFDEQGMEWNGVSATVDEIAAARARLMLSFGSCSFDEPRDDLRLLNLL